MASSSIISWQTDGEAMETVTDFIFLGSKSLWMMTAATKLKDTCSLKGKLWQCIKKQRHHFANKLVYSQSYDFSSSHVQMWELDHKESWSPRIDVFEFWCWRRLWSIPWTARRSNQSILKEINPEYSLEGLILKLKFQYFGHLIRRANSLEKTLMLGKTEGKGEGDIRGWDG